MKRLHGSGGPFATFLAVLGALTVWVQPSQAQLLQGSITGNVTDASQAAVVGAKVVATEQTTNFTRDTTTNAAGAYNLPTLPPGTYTITVIAPSFQTSTTTGIRLAPEQVVRSNVVLAIGQLTQNVEVTADAIALQTDRADIRDDVTIRSLQNVPVPVGRNYQMLFITVPGVSPPTNANSFTANSNRGLIMTVNGGNSNTNTVRVDGTGTYDFTAPAEPQFIPALEEIENVSISGNSFDAEQQSGGGAVNITVKSGTNSIHGVLFEDHTDQHMEAYPWASDRTKPAPVYINNQYGGTIGGPIKKDKLFYFGSFEGTGLIQGAPFFGEVPTAAMRTGNLSASPTTIYNPLTGNPDGTGRVPFSGNIIQPNQIDSGVRALLDYSAAHGNLWSLPNQAGIGSVHLANNLLTTGKTYLRRAQSAGKVNWNPNAKLSTFVRLGWGNNSWTTPAQFGVLGGPGLSPTNTAQGSGATNVFNGTVSGTYIISPSLIFDAHYGYDVNIAVSNQPGQDQNFGWTLMQIKGLDTSSLPKYKALQQGGLPSITIDGGITGLGSASRFQPQDYWDPERNYDANLTWVKGNHNFRFGFDSDIQNSKESQYQPASGSYISSAGGFHFAQQTTQLCTSISNGSCKTSAANEYNSFASFLLGLSQDAGKIFQWPDYYYTNMKYFAGYARDQWQVTPKLTVNVGLRFDYFAVPGRQDTGAEYYDQATNNMVICGIANIPKHCGVLNQFQSHFAPRFGAAYRLGDRTVIRAGFGISSDPANVWAPFARINFPYIEGVIQLPPNVMSYALSLRQGINVPPNPFPLTTGQVPVPGTAGLRDFDRGYFKRGYIQTYNFTIEERIRAGWTASVAYAGSAQIDPWANIEENWSPIGTGTAGLLLNTPGRNGQAIGDGRIASTPALGVMGTTTYNAFQARTQGRFADLTLSMGYTFSKNLGFTPPSGVTGGAAMPWLFRTYDYGPLSTDIAQNFEMTAIYELPFGKGKRWASGGMANYVVGGWQISGLFSDFTGRPFSVVANNNLNANGSFQRANCLGEPIQSGTLLHWYDPSTFAAPASTGFGNCGENVLRGPGLINLDLSIQKKFSFRERWNFAFLAEMFNVGNTPHHASPGYGPSTGTTSANNVQNSAFMNVTQIANTGRDGIDQRTLRLSLKLTF
ncbi:MAG TPA: TonB-dependent receptor [Bryobacteraceae bacterium]|jgi:Carboxypeptidase regulatory-like domain/TonB dependent receptor|nr:TonB-dependent receptor [Bryobacteraceae bacterium]